LAGQKKAKYKAAVGKDFYPNGASPALALAQTLIFVLQQGAQEIFDQSTFARFYFNCYRHARCQIDSFPLNLQSAKCKVLLFN